MPDFGSAVLAGLLAIAGLRILEPSAGRPFWHQIFAVLFGSLGVLLYRRVSQRLRRQRRRRA